MWGVRRGERELARVHLLDLPIAAMYADGQSLGVVQEAVLRMLVSGSWGAVKREFRYVQMALKGRCGARVLDHSKPHSKPDSKPLSQPHSKPHSKLILNPILQSIPNPF